MTFPPRHKNPHRPYARMTKFGPSVTRVLDAMGSATEALAWAAAKETALFAVDQPQEWRELPREDAIERLRKHHRGLWDGRSAMGTLVHSVNEAWANGEEADIDELVHAAAHPPVNARGYQPVGVQIWKGREQFVATEAEGYVDGLERFWQDFQPNTIGIEEVVHHDDGAHSYIGQRDWTVELAGLPGVSQIDVKTTAKQADEATASNPYPGLYFDKFRLQHAAYRKAEKILHFDASNKVVGEYPAYPVERCLILSLRGDGAYQLLEVQAAGDEWATFLRLIDVHRWVSSGHKTPAPVDLTVGADKEAAA